MAAAILAIALVTPARADLITLSGGTAGTIPGGSEVNDFIAGFFTGPTIGGYYGSQITVNVPALSLLTFEFFGAEAGYHNEFLLGGSELFDHPGGTIIAPSIAMPLGTFATTIVGTGTLPFSFEVGSDAASVANGSNPDDSGGAALGPNFFASCNPFGTVGGPSTCNQVYLFLDDRGPGPDDKDDFLVRVTISGMSVPEPSNLALLAVALAGAALSRRRKLH